jgi:hypothetical protein
MEVISRYCRIRDKVIMTGEGTLFKSEVPFPEWQEAAFAFLKIDYPKYYRMDPLSRLGFIAAELVLKGAITGYRPESVAVVFANRSASLDTDQRYYHAAQSVSSPGLFVYTLPNIVTGEIAIRHQIKGENAFFVSEQFDPEMLREYVHQLLEQPSVNACLAGWVEVLGAHHDVLLYLVEKRPGHGDLPHTTEQINSLYRK